MSDVRPSTFVAGKPLPSGAYLLRIRLRSACDVCFGRFNGGQPVHLPAGDYVYFGSAMGVKGSATLTNRLLRHARRTGGGCPHAIYGDLNARFVAMGWLDGAKPAHPDKHLRWHIDYLLDRAESELVQVFVFCSHARIEAQLVDYLSADPATHVFASGLGASDSPGSTHLLHVIADEIWWQRAAELARSALQLSDVFCV